MCLQYRLWLFTAFSVLFTNSLLFIANLGVKYNVILRIRNIFD
jgi:hypothetical protein